MFDMTRGREAWGTLGNDIAGDCVLAGLAHITEAWLGFAANLPVAIPDAEVLAAYSRMTNWDPVTHVPDPGMTIHDGVNYVVANPFTSGSLSAANIVDAEIGRITKRQFQNWIFWFGGIVISLNLPAAASTAWRQHQPWAGDMGPGENSHCMVLISYDQDTFECITWGGLQRIRWDFINLYFQNAWLCRGRDMFINDVCVTCGLGEIEYNDWLNWESIWQWH